MAVGDAEAKDEVTEGKISDDIGDRVSNLTQSILDLEAKSEAGVDFHPTNRSAIEKYKPSLKQLLPVRFSKIPKDEFPLTYTGFFGLLTYGWLTPLLWKVFKTGVDAIQNVKCAYADTAEVNANRLEKLWNEQLQMKGEEKASFGRALFQAVKTRVFVGFFIIFVFVCFSLANPIFLIRNFLQYLSQDGFEVKYGIAYVAGMVFCEIGRTLSASLFWIVNYQSGVRLRTGATSLLFHKILRLKGLKNKTIGELVNIVGNDGQRIFEATTIGPLIIGGPIILLGGAIYSLLLLGPWGLIGCSIFIGFYPFSALISRLTAALRRKGIAVTDKRVRMMSELLSCIKLIKMYAWEKPFAQTIADIRAEERSVLEKGAYVQSLSTSIATMVPVFAAVLTFVAYVVSGNDLTATKAFTFVALLNAMRFSLGVIPYAIKSLTEASISVKRFKSVMIMDEMMSHSSEMDSERQRVVFEDASFSWDVETSDTPSKNENPLKPGTNGTQSEAEAMLKTKTEDSKEPDNRLELALNSISFALDQGKLVGVCGSVGCGKSSLVSAILGRMELQSGRIAVRGTIAYVSQQAWIMNATVRENILFGLPYDEQRYKAIVEACALKEDFEGMVSGDETEIGERGINLSGGQKQRISLARAVYSDSEIYLLDDPLSAVDVHIGHHIVNHCLLKQLRGKTVLFVTHQLQYLVHTDEVLFMKDGQIAEKGLHQDLMEADKDYANLMKIYYSEHTEEVEEEEEETKLEPRVRLSSMSACDRPDKKSPNVNENRVEKLPAAMECLKEKPPFERMFSRGAGIKLERQFSAMSVISNAPSDHSDDGKLIVAEERDQGAVTWGVYLSYMRAGGGVFLSIVVILLFLVAIASQTAASWFLSFWLNQGSGNTTITEGNITRISRSITDHPDRELYTIIYGCFTVLMVFLMSFRAFIFMKVTLKASSGLHDRVFEKILRSPMFFFDSTPLGRIINRFSVDMDEIDVRLPMNAEVFISNIILVIFSLGMIAYVSPWFLIALIPITALFFFLFVLFVRCSRQLKRQDAVTRSPLISLVTAAVQGISTIHAYGKVDEFLGKFHSLMDCNTVPFFIFFTSNRWLAVRLDLICCLVTMVTGLIIIFTHDKMTPALAGLALSFAVQMAGLFQFTVRLAIETESRFTSVQRIEDYAENVEQEGSDIIPDRRPPPEWPTQGKVSFCNLKMRYREGLPLALKGVSFDVCAQEKIGIVGRSGSGKSSLAVALFRLVDAASGSIAVDGIDISKIGLYDLRSKLSIIPQDPVLFVGTVRYNLDPFSDHKEEELWLALEKCHVKDMIAALDEKLEAPVVENGENFSVGERQLICMARALLRNSKILILDEATAAIDTETDTLVQTALKEAFSECTMLTIAHRLNTVLGCDRILVLEDGKVAEYDKPSVLMSKPNSKFKAMLNATESQQAS